MSIINFFRKLQWKLAISYMLVTSIVLMLLISFIWGLIWLFVMSNGRWQTISQALGTLAVSINSEHLVEPKTPKEIDDYINLFEMEEFGEGDLNALLIANIDGEVVATNPPKYEWTENLVENLPPDAIDLYVKSLQPLNGSDYLHRYEYPESDQVLMFIPITSELDSDEVLGTVIFSYDSAEGLLIVQFIALMGLAFILIAVSIPVLLFAILFGLLFGMWASRGMSRRLNLLSDATNAWSSGDFSIRIKDRSKDEIGILGNNLNHMTDQLEQLLASRSELAMIDERNRLARDLHDSAKQQIFATSMQLTTARMLLEANPEAAKKHLLEAESLARQVQKELSVLIEELRPPQLEGKGLFVAVRDMSQNFVRQNKIPIDFKMQGRRDVPFQVEQTIFRVFQECMSNIAKHSYAERISVYIGATNEILTLTIEDNGIGFDTSDPSTGLGMYSMQERIEELSGTFDITSTIGEGTIVHATCPLTRS